MTFVNLYSAALIAHAFSLSDGKWNMADDCKRGRKRTLTDSARKKNRKRIQSNYNKTRINIGSEFDRWNALKSELDLSSHEEVAKVLLDRCLAKSEGHSPPR